MKKEKSLLKNMIKQLLDKSSLQAGAVLIIPQDIEVRKLLDSLFGMLKQNISNFNEYIKSIENVEHFLMDSVLEWCIKEEIEGVKEEISDLSKKLSADKYQELLEKLSKQFLKLPYDYKFILKTNLKNKYFKGLDLKISSTLRLKGLGINTNLMFQYGVSAAYNPMEFENKEGENLCFVGEVTGYIPKVYPNNDLIEKISDDIKICTALMNINNIISFPIYKSDITPPAQLGFYQNNKYFNYSNLENDFSNALLNCSLNDKFAFNHPQLGLAGMIAKKEEDNLSNFNRNMYPLIKIYSQFEDSNTSKLVRKQFNKFMTALRWYLMSVINENESISFTSIAIAFESLIGSTDRNLGKKTEISERTSLLLGKSINDRTEIVENIKSGYNIRNSIMHQGYTVTNEDKRLLFKLQEYFRRIILHEQSILLN